MKVGVVGVGRWGHILSMAFWRSHPDMEIAAYDRKSDKEAPGMGARIPWRDMVASKEVDAVIAATPPDTTIEVMYACIGAGKPCFLTKPVFTVDPPQISSVVHVDYVHAMSRLCSLAAGESTSEDDPLARLDVTVAGDGPDRSFPGPVDYGPHAVAMMRIFMPNISCRRFEVGYEGSRKIGWEEKRLTLETKLEVRGVSITLRFGNAHTRRKITATATTKSGKVVEYASDGPASGVWVNGERMTVSVEDELQAMARRFKVDVEKGTINPWYLETSALATRLIDRATNEAK